MQTTIVTNIKKYFVSTIGNGNMVRAITAGHQIVFRCIIIGIYFLIAMSNLPNSCDSPYVTK